MTNSMHQFLPNVFIKQPIPDVLPAELEAVIEGLVKTEDRESFLKEAFFFVVNRWGGNRINFILKFQRLFEKDLNKILATEGYLHCTTMNFLLRVMAVKSGLFQDEEIRLRWTHTWYLVPHQYLKIRIAAGKTINLDPWNYQYGVDYGKVGSGFASIRFKPIRGGGVVDW